MGFQPTILRPDACFFSLTLNANRSMFVHMTVETFIQRLTTILAALAALVAARLLHHPTLARQIIPLWTYITHLPHRIERTLTHPPRPRHPRPPREDPEPEDSEPASETDQPVPRRPRWHLPTSKIWLIRVLGWEAAGYASQLRCLLAEPGAQAILAACPAAQRRLLPLVHILIPSHWDNPFPCTLRPIPRPRAQRPNTPNPSAPNPLPCPPEKLA